MKGPVSCDEYPREYPQNIWYYNFLGGMNFKHQKLKVTKPISRQPVSGGEYPRGYPWNIWYNKV